MANVRSFIVQGEASESDEEDYMSPVHRGQMNPQDLVASIAGEDVSSEDDLNITISAFASKIEEANSPEKQKKYNSLLHKKLQESNWKVKEGIKTFIRSSLFYAKEQINEVNRSLLTTQVEAQETLKALRSAQSAVKRTNFTLDSVLRERHVPETNVVLIS